MKKIGFCVAAVLATVVLVPRSHAIGGEQLGCFVNVGKPGVYQVGSCGAELPQSSYDAIFHVLGGSGTYTYAWTHSSGTISSGCGSTDDFCIIHVLGNTARHVITVNATLFQSGLQNTVSATAEIEPVCGNAFC